MESQTPAPALLSVRASQFVILGLRVLTSIFLVVSLAILLSNVLSGDRDHKVHFYDFVPYRYMAAAIVIGIAYSLFQTAVTVIRIRRENHRSILLDFYGDKVISNVVATGAVAGFVMTAQVQKDWSELVGIDAYDKYIKRSHAADGLVLLAFVCTFMLSVLSSYALPKKVY
ncbi:CASP-like protein 4D1 [Pyrus x bretschneideri]|uniref:CASP-like protein 4D1 n=1 Tax=Pyrus x bretschneideri TaxID=225117 RepID=UPI000510A7C7|nr:CASP-like protein 4D1 [Pyrus x bretschneideri]